MHLSRLFVLCCATIMYLSGLALCEQSAGDKIANLFSTMVSIGGPPTDVYQRKYYDRCIKNDITSCIVSRGLSLVDYYMGQNKYQVYGDIDVVKVPNQDDGLVEMSSAPRSTESEMDQFVKFIFRKAERFTKSYALSVRLNDENTSQGRYLPAVVEDRDVDDDEDEFDDDDELSRFKKKKKFIKYIVPLLVLIKAFKIKLLLIPILIGVIIIKKVLLLGILAIPIVLAFLRFCKGNQDKHHDQWATVSTSYSPHSSYGTDKEDSYGSFSSYLPSFLKSRNWDPQDMAYRGQQDTNTNPYYQ